MTFDMSCQGKCLCGAVEVMVTMKDNHISACHCDMCRKWGGGPFLAAEPVGDVSFTGADYIIIFSSSEWAERGFCKQCGTHLFYRLKHEKHYAIPAGLLDESDWLLTEQIFIDQKPGFYTFANSTSMLTGEEVFAQHSSES